MAYSEDLFETVESRHGTVTFFANDTGAITESLRKYGEWAENELSFMLSAVREGDTVIDVGAYIGTHCLAFAEHVKNTGHVISIEAQIRSFEILQRNIQANELSNVRLENAMASSAAKEEVIPSIDIASPASYGSASLRDVTKSTNGDALGGHEGLTVHAVAVDDLDVSSCSLIKIDVEGMEDVVLSGARKTVERCRPVVYAECNSLEDGLRSVAVLRSFNYRVRAHVVLAYNEHNFRQNAENIFGGAREVALVAVHASGPDPFASYVLRPCELLVDVETADDLALALLNKPQYEHEVLRDGAAAKSGGLMCLEEARLIRSACDERQQAIDHLRGENEELRADYERERRASMRLEMKLETSREQMHRIEDIERESRQHAEAVEREYRQRAEAAEATVAELLRSTSWRVTAPFRALGHILRGRRS